MSPEVTPDCGLSAHLISVCLGVFCFVVVVVVVVVSVLFFFFVLFCFVLFCFVLFKLPAETRVLRPEIPVLVYFTFFSRTAR